MQVVLAHCGCRCFPMNSEEEEDVGIQEIRMSKNNTLEGDYTWNDNLLADVAWQDQLAKYNSVGMGDNDVVREHKTYVRKVHMMKSLTRKFIKLFEYFLT